MTKGLRGVLKKKKWKFEAFFSVTQKRWFSPYYVLTDTKGLTCAVSENPQGVTAWDYEEEETIPGHFVPGLVNAHSHAFQYGMAGLAESVSLKMNQEDDDFWFWREKMYSVALKISPEALKSVAAYLYSQMLCSGYSHVVEFHYLHKNLDGKPYGTPTLLGEILIEAAREVGMGMTLVPVYYKQSHFGQRGLQEQRRFLFEDVGEYLDLVDGYGKLINQEEQIFLGMGVHSLRAADREDIKKIYSHCLNRPFHLHIAEQVKEVEDCVEFYGKRPVQWFLDEVHLNDGHHGVNFIHSTHMTKEEFDGVLEKNVNVILCPSTEGNLGDGFFPISEYIKARGSWAVGSDSQIGLNPYEELRWLDYGARLNNKKRNVLSARSSVNPPMRSDNLQTQFSSGEQVFLFAFNGGERAAGIAQVLNAPAGEGRPLSGVVVNHPLMDASSDSDKLSTLIYALNGSAHSKVLSRGRVVAKEGKHFAQDKLAQDFYQAIKEMRVSNEDRKNQ